MITTEPLYYLNPDAEGYFTIAFKTGERFFQESYPLRELNNCLSFTMWFNLDTYITQNIFSQPNRKCINLSHITQSFVDLDTYKTDFGFQPPEKQAEDVLNHCVQNQIPLPSIINFSGQGLHVKWFYAQNVSAAVLPEWQLLENQLIQKFHRVSADASAKDASRMLRLTGTKNPKTGKLASTLYENKEDGGIKRYDFYSLYQSIVPEVVKPEPFSSPKKNTVLQPGSIISLMKMNWLRVLDIIKLAEIRGYDKSVPTGSRNNFLFVISCHPLWR